MLRELLIGVFFFKQKTAYEMRISDWSSDVCSSDLPKTESDRRERQISLRDDRACPRPGRNAPHPASHIPPKRAESGYIQPKANDARWLSDRSEEHTSELQSLMRISYAVFCLKKKNTQTHKDIYTKSKIKNIL